MHPEQLLEVLGGYGLGDRPQKWWRRFEHFVEELNVDQHAMDPCVFLLRELSTDEQVGRVSLQ